MMACICRTRIDVRPGRTGARIALDAVVVLDARCYFGALRDDEGVKREGDYLLTNKSETQRKSNRRCA